MISSWAGASHPGELDDFPGADRPWRILEVVALLRDETRPACIPAGHPDESHQHRGLPLPHH
jgi:hypothetical protein